VHASFRALKRPYTSAARRVKQKLGLVPLRDSVRWVCSTGRLVVVFVAVDVAVAVADCGAILDALKVLSLAECEKPGRGKQLLHRVVSMLVKMAQ